MFSVDSRIARSHIDVTLEMATVDCRFITLSVVSLSFSSIAVMLYNCIIISIQSERVMHDNLITSYIRLC